MKINRVATPAFGLVAWLEKTQIHLPLKAVECEFEVSGGAVDVQIDQVFYQSADRPLDVTYSFPLPSRAAVYRCEMIVNDRVIRAKVEEKHAARQIAAQKKAEGRRVALVEMERGNLFTLSLGNTQPCDLIVIRFAYFEELDAWQNELALQIPFTPGVRYIPGKPLLRSNSGKGTVDDTDQVPDASRISPPRIDQFHPDAANLVIQGRLDARDTDITSISSPTHLVGVRPAQERHEIFLPAGESVPDGDFVLRWKHSAANAVLPMVWLREEAEYRYALLQLRAPSEAPVTSCNEGSDIYFLVDRSSSMEGAKWSKTIEALHEFVRALGENDRVWITLFNTGHEDFAEKPMSRDAILSDRGFLRLETKGVSGGTEILPGLRHVLDMRRIHSGERKAHLVVITDGQVGNEAAILNAVANANIPIHCFGIDDAVNEAFLRELAASQGGLSVFLTPSDDLARPIGMLGAQLRYPVLTDLTLSEGWELAGPTLPDLHAGQVAFVAARALREAGELRVSGKEMTVQMEARLCASELPKLIWSKHRIDGLLRAGKDEEAIAIAKAANVICRGAAFIAWDEAERVAVAKDEVYQPSITASEQTLARAAFGLYDSLEECAPMACAAPAPMSAPPPSPKRTQALGVSRIRSLAPKAMDPAKALRKLLDGIFGWWNGRKLGRILEDWQAKAGEEAKQKITQILAACEAAPEGDRPRLIQSFMVVLPAPWGKQAAELFQSISVK